LLERHAVDIARPSVCTRTPSHRSVHPARVFSRCISNRAHFKKKQVIANDKLKAERDKQKGKKKAPSAASKKASIAQSHNPAFDNTDEYGNFGDDDFM
jgi:hypothetical protein